MYRAIKSTNMKLFLTAGCLFCITAFQYSYCQTPAINREAFLNDTAVIHATLVVNMARVFSHSKNPETYYGHFITSLPDGRKVNDPVLLEPRGHFRRGFCYIPPLKLKFNYKDSSTLYSLKSLKLVSECNASVENEQNLLKEFLVYKIYNLISSRSFHARLLNLTFQDSSGKKKPINEHAFILEDISDVAKRNDCTEWKSAKLKTEATDRKQMTVVAIFEFMIGNTDWAVSVDHNTRLIVSTKDTFSKPFVVPYDFDYSGLVNTYYAVPDEKLEIENVTERVYRGFPRTMPEIEEVLDSFKLVKKDIYALINNFSLLNKKSKENMIDYLEGFYTVIKSTAQVKTIFIENARTQ
jgi:hypothetical protein